MCGADVGLTILIFLFFGGFLGFVGGYSMNPIRRDRAHWRRFYKRSDKDQR